MVRLTDIAIRNLKPGTTRREIPDQHQRGLYLVLQPTGNKVFCVRYRFDGRPRKLTLQAGISLAAARKEAADALYQVQQGKDPAVAKARAKEERRAAAADTLEAVAAEFFKREGDKLRSTRDWQRDLARLVFPTLGKRPIADVRRKDIVRLLDNIQDNNGAGQADATLAIIRRVMNWHSARDDDFRTPIVRGMNRHKANKRERVLNDDELRAVWRAADSTQGPFGHYVKFLLLTACRRNEAAHLTRGEIVGDDWFLPASRNKTKVDLKRPLSVAALSVLERTPRIAGSDFVFTSDGRRLGGITRRKKELDETCGVTGWTLHDLRRTSRSLMSRSKTISEHAERCLGHVIPGVEGIYNRYPYRDEMLLAYEKLSTLIGQIVDPQPNVVTMARARDDFRR
jgi:integrase